MSFISKEFLSVPSLTTPCPTAPDRREKLENLNKYYDYIKNPINTWELTSAHDTSTKNCARGTMRCNVITPLLVQLLINLATFTHTYALHVCNTTCKWTNHFRSSGCPSWGPSSSVPCPSSLFEKNVSYCTLISVQFWFWSPKSE